MSKVKLDEVGVNICCDIIQEYIAIQQDKIFKEIEAVQRMSNDLRAFSNEGDVQVVLEDIKYKRSEIAALYTVANKITTDWRKRKMSDYVKLKVLRIPAAKMDFNRLEKLEEAGKTGWCDPGKFGFAPTEEPFMDYTLEAEDGEGEYGKVRELYPSEKEKYASKFHEIDPAINMDDVRLIEFCWYNCSEAPGYYTITQDSFYDEV